MSASVAPLALVPAKSPLRNKYWVTNDGVVAINDSLRVLLISEHIDVSDSTNSKSLQADDSGVLVVLDVPVLSVSELVEDSSI